MGIWCFKIKQELNGCDVMDSDNDDPVGFLMSY